MTTGKDDVFNYWTLVSDDLIPHGSGQYTDTFKCNMENKTDVLNSPEDVEDLDTDG